MTIGERVLFVEQRARIIPESVSRNVRRVIQQRQPLLDYATPSRIREHVYRAGDNAR